MKRVVIATGVALVFTLQVLLWPGFDARGMVPPLLLTSFWLLAVGWSWRAAIVGLLLASTAYYLMSYQSVWPLLLGYGLVLGIWKLGELIGLHVRSTVGGLVMIATGLVFYILVRSVFVAVAAGSWDIDGQIISAWILISILPLLGMWFLMRSILLYGEG